MLCSGLDYIVNITEDWPNRKLWLIEKKLREQQTSPLKLKLKMAAEIMQNSISSETAGLGDCFK